MATSGFVVSASRSLLYIVVKSPSRLSIVAAILLVYDLEDDREEMKKEEVGWWDEVNR